MTKAVVGRRRLLLIFCCITLVSAFVIRSGTNVAARGVQDQASRAGSGERTAECGGEPCAAVVRGGLAFLDRRLRGLEGNGRSCADCHMPTDHFQLSPANVEKRFRLLSLFRRFNPNADDPLFRPVDADDFRTNHENASDFSNLRQNGLVRIVFDLPRQISLVDPVTNLVSNESRVDVWRMVPTVNDVKLTGDDGENPWPRIPNVTGGYQLDGRFADLQEQARAALETHAQIRNAAPQRLLDDLASFQRVLFTNDRVRALSDAISSNASPLPDPDPTLNELETQGKAVFVRACAQCHGGPRQSTTPFPIVRYHDILTQCPRPPQNPLFAFKPCPPRLARNARTYEIEVSAETTLPNGMVVPKGGTIRRTSSDPGRAFQTGFVGGFAAVR